MLFTDKCIEALVVRGAILMSRFLQGEESDSFSWLNPSGFIDSVREKRGLRDATAAQEEQDAKTRRIRRWRLLVVTTTVAVVAGGGIFLYRNDGKKVLQDLWQDLRSGAWKAKLLGTA
jgi:hypothetical protein